MHTSGSASRTQINDHFRLAVHKAINCICCEPAVTRSAVCLAVAAISSDHIRTRSPIHFICRDRVSNVVNSPMQHLYRRHTISITCPSSKVPKYRLETFQLHGSGGLLTMVAKLATIASNNIIALTSLCSAAPLGCKHGTGCVCCWAPAPVVDRYLLPAGSCSYGSKGGCCRQDGRTDRRTPDR